jgi:FkbM family methyltransferase
MLGSNRHAAAPHELDSISETDYTTCIHIHLLLDALRGRLILMAARAVIAALRHYIRNIDIDWEHILRINYNILIPKNSDIVDIGANQGFHSEKFVHELQCRKLVAFEPIPQLNERLISKFSAFPNVQVRSEALGSTNAEQAFYVKQGTLGESGLRPKANYGDGTSDNLVPIQVQVRVMDDLDLDVAPRYIKIDIEGGEIDCLNGAVRTIARARPLVSIEYGRNGFEAFGHQKPALWQYCNQVGYVIHDLLGNEISTPEEYEGAVCQYYWDYLLVPHEQNASLNDAFARIRRLAFPLPIIGRPRQLDLGPTDGNLLRDTNENLAQRISLDD